MTYNLYAYLYAQVLSVWEKGLQIVMGRAGIEPATLGLKVRPIERQRAAAS
jgi:hypothetical protein